MLVNISLIKREDLPSQIFDDFGVPLIPLMGKQFIQAIIYYAEKIFESEVVNLDEEMMDTLAVKAGNGEKEAEASGPKMETLMISPRTNQGDEERH